MGFVFTASLTPGVAAAPSAPASQRPLTIVHAFDNNADGTDPYSDFTLAPDGNLYGATSTGGPTNNGALFRVVLGRAYRTIASLPKAIGSNVVGRLTVGPDGQLYGGTCTTVLTVFKVSTGGIFECVAPLYRNFKDRVTFGTDGSLYGVTQPVYGAGTVYRVARNGALSTIATFKNQMAGNVPNPLTLGPDGNL